MMLTKLLICLIKTVTKKNIEGIVLYAFVVSITNSFLGGEMLHCWSDSEFGLALKQHAKTMKLTSFMLDYYYIVLIFIEVFPLHSWHFKYRCFTFTIISPFIVLWHFWQKLVFCKIFFSCKNSVCWPINVRITTNLLMLIGE